MFFLFWWFLIAIHEPLAYLEAGIAVGMPAHLAGWTHDQGCTHLVALFGLPLRVANYLRTTAGAFPAGIPGVDPAGDDTGLVPRLVFGVAENAALHPEGSLHVSSVTIPAFLRFQIAEVFKHQKRGSLRTCELDNAVADLVGKILVTMIDFALQIGIVLLAECK